VLIAFPAYAGISTSWKLLYQPRQRIVKTISVYEEKIFIGTGNGIFVSKDNGESWERFNTASLQKDISGNSTINWISLDEENQRIYIATTFGAYYSELGNIEWKKLFEEFPDRFVIGSDINTGRFDNYDRVMDTFRSIVLKDLSKATAEKIAFKNAWRFMTGKEWED